MIVHLHWYVSRELGECWISLASDDYIDYSSAQTIELERILLSNEDSGDLDWPPSFLNFSLAVETVYHNFC